MLCPFPPAQVCRWSIWPWCETSNLLSKHQLDCVEEKRMRCWTMAWFENVFLCQEHTLQYSPYATIFFFFSRRLIAFCLKLLLLSLQASWNCLRAVSQTGDVGAGSRDSWFTRWAGSAGSWSVLRLGSWCAGLGWETTITPGHVPEGLTSLRGLDVLHSECVFKSSPL